MTHAKLPEDEVLAAYVPTAEGTTAEGMTDNGIKGIKLNVDTPTEDVDGVQHDRRLAKAMRQGESLLDKKKIASPKNLPVKTWLEQEQAVNNMNLIDWRDIDALSAASSRENLNFSPLQYRLTTRSNAYKYNQLHPMPLSAGPARGLDGRVQQNLIPGGGVFPVSQFPTLSHKLNHNQLDFERAEFDEQLNKWSYPHRLFPVLSQADDNYVAKNTSVIGNRFANNGAYINPSQVSNRVSYCVSITLIDFRWLAS